jgi:hypothetical protein
MPFRVRMIGPRFAWFKGKGPGDGGIAASTSRGSPEKRARGASTEPSAWPGSDIETVAHELRPRVVRARQSPRLGSGLPARHGKRTGGGPRRIPHEARPEGERPRDAV